MVAALATPAAARISFGSNWVERSCVGSNCGANAYYASGSYCVGATVNGNAYQLVVPDCNDDGVPNGASSSTCIQFTYGYYWMGAWDPAFGPYSVDC
jgi:hypothetical protein